MSASVVIQVLIMLSQMLKHIQPFELQKLFNEGDYNAGMMQGSRLEMRILTIANRSWREAADIWNLLAVLPLLAAWRYANDYAALIDPT